jgi:hypothetical protein
VSQSGSIEGGIREEIVASIMAFLILNPEQVVSSRPEMVNGDWIDQPLRYRSDTLQQSQICSPPFRSPVSVGRPMSRDTAVERLAFEIDHDREGVGSFSHARAQGRPVTASQWVTSATDATQYKTVQAA